MSPIRPVVLLLLVPSFSSLPATAQGPRTQPAGPGPAEGQAATLRTAGTIKAVRPGVITITAGQEDWLVSIPRNLGAIEYHATASTDWLQRNMDVRFNALLDKRGRAQHDIQKLTVVTLRRGSESGLLPETEVPSENQRRIDPPANERNRPPRRKILTVSCVVIGRLLGIRKGTMVVMAGPHRVEAPLAGNAQITVQMNDYRLAQPGDKVEVQARYDPARRGQALAERLVITAAKPLGHTAGPEAQKTAGQAKTADNLPGAR